MDLVILGGGIVGLVLANLLAQQTNLKITLIEAKPINLNWDASSYDLRCSAITRASENTLRSIGVWESILACRVGIYDSMHVWDGATKAEINFNCKHFGEKNLGYIIENSLIQHVLLDRLMNIPKITIRNTEAIRIEMHTEFNRVYFADGYIDAKLIIGADGANSWLRSALNIPVMRNNYEQSALVAIIKSSISHQQTAMQCFTNDGPLAFLPLDDPHLSSIVWSSKPEVIQELMTVAPDEFASRLSVEFEHRLGTLELCGQRASFRLQMLHAQTYIAARAALVGDAIHVVHPLAGQGLNMGISDALCLANIIANASNQSHDIGTRHVLRKYERQRKGQNIATLVTVDFFKRAFAVQNKHLRNIRDWGIGLFERSAWIKRNLALQALGIHNE